MLGPPVPLWIRIFYRSLNCRVFTVFAYWVKVFKIVPEFRDFGLTSHLKILNSVKI